MKDKEKTSTNRGKSQLKEINVEINMTHLS